MSSASYWGNMIVALSFEEISGKLLVTVLKRDSPESSSLSKLLKAVSCSSCSSSRASGSAAVTEGVCGGWGGGGRWHSGECHARVWFGWRAQAAGRGCLAARWPGLMPDKPPEEVNERWIVTKCVEETKRENQLFSFGRCNL